MINRDCVEKGGDPEKVLTAGLHAALLQFAAHLAHAHHCSADVVPGYAQIEKGDDEARPWGMDVLQAYMDKQLGKEYVPSWHKSYLNVYIVIRKPILSPVVCRQNASLKVHNVH